ncbi:hypothetical protein [Streptomyces sp. 35G-GA-8]|uniref:hypothetical protein n=1 Tax=Streptomyces sp. 35G-GA-8 TaxID=2939434 RepID=UPI00201EDFAC|nr:hypothetical protein [Streptomyces sp. 35G-GA-8]MCL7377438.1 hypothetical protein [Streptomyces sp. 35G-GA-8]
MTHMPQAAVTTIAAALDDYRLTTPTEQQTPDEAAERVAEYLASSGWGLHITDEPAAA